MKRIGIIGPESTGKTTLAHFLAKEMGGVAVEEYAREYVENLQGQYTYDDVVIIAKKQIEQLYAQYDAEYIFFDTELIITKVWFEDKYGQVPPVLTEALKENPIDLYLLCKPDIAAIDDPVRENLNRREELFRWYEREIQQSGKPYFIVEGTGEDREKTIKQFLWQTTKK